MYVCVNLTTQFYNVNLDRLTKLRDKMYVVYDMCVCVCVCACVCVRACVRARVRAFSSQLEDELVKTVFIYS